MEFCKAFNAATQEMEKNSPIPVTITIFADKSFTYTMKQPPVSYFLLKTLGLPKGSQKPGHEVAGSISQDQLREIAEKKMADLNADTIEAAMQQIAGSARAMGLEVQG